MTRRWARDNAGDSANKQAGIPQQGQPNDRQHVTQSTTYEREAMKKGHVTGHKREKKGLQDWYRQIQEEHLRKIEAEWKAKQGK
jgi:hypothetical protein